MPAQPQPDTGLPQTAHPLHESSPNVIRLFGVLLRQKWIILSGILFGVGLGTLYLYLATPRFIATASLLIVSQTQPETGPDMVRGQAAIDSVRVDTQVEVMRSDRAVRGVLARLDPAERAALGRDVALMRLSGRSSPDSSQESAHAELETLRRSLHVRRLERTYVLAVSYTSGTPALAAAVANAFVQEYVGSQVQSRSETTEQAQRQLQARAAQLAQDIAAAELESMQVFRSSRAADASIMRKRELDLKVEGLKQELDAIVHQLQAMSQTVGAVPSDARVIVKATVPTSPAQPRTMMVLVLAVVFGITLGGSIAAAREMFDQTFRTGAAVTDGLQLPFLGLLPRLPAASRAAQAASLRLSGPEGAVPVPAPLLVAREYPFSRYAETLRTTRVAVEMLRPTHGAVVIGITSVLPREGKTTFAANLAFSMAAEGASVLLVDADIRRRGLTTLLAPQAKGGLIDHASSRQHPDPSSSVLTEETTGLAFLPAGSGRTDRHPASLPLAGVQSFLTAARSRYDVVILDMPPAGIVADAGVFLAAADAFVFVTLWGRTPQAAVAKRLEAKPQLRQRLLGVVLNGVDLRRLGAYEAGGEAKTSAYDDYFEEPAAKRSVARLP